MRRIYYTYQFLLIILFVSLSSSTYAQSWELEKVVEGVEIYSRAVVDSDLKEIKMDFQLDIGLSPIVSILHDDQKLTEWVYNCQYYEALDKTSPGNGYFYGVVDFPWPLDDRDYVLITSSSQDPVTKVVTIESKDAQHDLKKDKSKYVRMAQHHNRWTLTPESKNRTKLEYYLRSDPGGAIPNTLINLAIDKGAIQTILNMKTRLQSCCKDVRLAYILEK